MMRLWPILALSLLAMSAVAAPPSAEAVIAQARARAAREGKNAIVYFRASWCPWCKRMERLFADAVLGPRLRASYVIAPITVRERDELRKTENAGWPALMRRLRGTEDSDVPYLAILSPRGKKLGDSYRPSVGDIPGNAGYPRTATEIEAFVGLFRRTGPRLHRRDLIALRAYLQRTERGAR